MIISGLVLILAVVHTYLLVIALPNVAYFMCNNITYRIVESKNPGFKEGDCVVANFGWRTHTISNGENVYKLDRNMYTDQKLSTTLGVLGMPGYLYPCHTCITVYYHHYHVYSWIISMAKTFENQQISISI